MFLKLHMYSQGCFYWCIFAEHNMSSIYDSYEAVIGLEIHAQILTRSKAFSSDKAEYGDLPNSNVSAISLGHPGTLPRHNGLAVRNAVKLGIATHSQIRRENQYARKNYFYADLPKGYQITQDKTPICSGGYIKVKFKDGREKKIELTRIHMEEDSGKSIHDLDLYNSLIDYNRAGTPLVEIVTEPVIRSGEEAGLFVTEIRKLVRYLEICDGNMEEGSLRCDANISVRKKGAPGFGTKVEVKNMNSISNVRKAIEFEIIRQIDTLESGGQIFQETRSFDAVRGITFGMRAKELVNDYRYFPEPDLPPLVITEEFIDSLRSTMPRLPEELYMDFQLKHGLNDYDAAVLTDSREVAELYLEIAAHTSNFKSAANWVMGPIKAWLNKEALGPSNFHVPGLRIAQLIDLVDAGTVSNATAEQVLFPEMLRNPDSDPATLAESMNVVQRRDDDFIDELIDKALAAYPEKVEEYRNGKKGLMGLFMGEVMKLSGGKADPKVSTQKLREKLES